MNFELQDFSLSFVATGRSFRQVRQLYRSAADQAVTSW
jgi:hypothetical protein